MSQHHAELRARVDASIDGFIARFHQEVPGALDQARGNEINMDYYRRNLVEIILRLRMKRTIDALTIHYFTRKNPRLAKKWCEYSGDEMLHDSMFAADLERVGMPHDSIYAHEPLLSTKLLQGYFYYGIEHEGKPLASLCSSYLIEYASQKTQPQIIANLERVLGPEYVKGQRAHVQHDEDDDHIDFVWEVLTQTANLPEEEPKIFAHIENVYKLLAMYYRELHQVTQAAAAQPLAA
jgi:hypothetical protein